MIAGRNFRAEEIQPPVTMDTTARFESQIIMTREMAERLFPNESAIGKTVFDQLRRPATVIGVVERMQAAWLDYAHLGNVFLLPRLPFSFSGAMYYIIRTAPGQRDGVARNLEEHLSTSNPNRLIDWIRPLQRFKDRAYAADRNMGIFLVAVTTLLVAICMLGIFGLATFNVSTRTKQIGTRGQSGPAAGYHVVLHGRKRNHHHNGNCAGLPARTGSGDIGCHYSTNFPAWTCIISSPASLCCGS